MIWESGGHGWLLKCLGNGNGSLSFIDLHTHIHMVAAHLPHAGGPLTRLDRGILYNETKTLTSSPASWSVCNDPFALDERERVSKESSSSYTSCSSREQTGAVCKRLLCLSKPSVACNILPRLARTTEEKDSEREREKWWVYCCWPWDVSVSRSQGKHLQDRVLKLVHCYHYTTTTTSF